MSDRLPFVTCPIHGSTPAEVVMLADGPWATCGVCETHVAEIRWWEPDQVSKEEGWVVTNVAVGE